MSDTRIYRVRDLKIDDDPAADYLIRAATPSQALRTAAGDRFSVRVATQDDMAQLIEAGVKIQTATNGDS